MAPADRIYDHIHDEGLDESNCPKCLAPSDALSAAHEKIGAMRTALIAAQTVIDASVHPRTASLIEIALSYPIVDGGCDVVLEDVNDTPCPSCHGEGRIQIGGESVNPYTGVPGPDPQEDHDERCPDCGGTGKA